MGAQPSIVLGKSSGYISDPNTIFLICLYENKASLGYTSGMVKFQGSKHDMASNICYQDLTNIGLICAPTTAFNLKNFGWAMVSGQGTFSYGCLESFGCSSGDNCTTIACAAWGARTSFETGIPVRPNNPTPPPSPTGLTITPGSGVLTIGWNPVTDPTGGEVFAYRIAILDGSTTVISGHTEAGLTAVTIGGLTNGKTYSVRVDAVSHNAIHSSVATGTGTPVGSTNPVVYDIQTTPTSPKAGDSITIKASLANTGPGGKVRAVFKVDGTQISDQNSTLNTYPGGGLWQPTAPYTMPNKTITISVEAYGWDGSNWVRTDTKSVTRTPSVTPCSGVTLTPYSASIKAGEKVTFTATVTPSTSPFTVQFKDRAGTLLGTCTTSGGSCTFIWDSTGKPSGTYYVKAYVVEGSCVSSESAILVSPAINQWNMNIYVKDSVTNAPVTGATVTAGTQSKTTDTTGLAMFRVDEGTTNISISNTGYNTFTTVELVFSDKTFNYVLSPTGIARGSIHFVTVPVGADIYLDGSPQGVITPVTVTDIPAGSHSFTLKLAGYNDFTGNATVTGGSVYEVYVVLTPATPGAGALYVFSIPMAADITIDGQPKNLQTPATITNLTAGSHEVKLSKTGYQDLIQTVTITAGTTTYLNVSLTVLSSIGTLEISSTPAGARVFIDGADVQKVTPATITNLFSGNHTYKLVLSGYVDATGTFTIESGKTTTVSVILAKAEAVGAGTIIVISLIGLGILGSVIVATRENKYSPPKEYPKSPVKPK